MIPTQTPRRTSAPLLMRRAVLVGLLLSLALLFGPPLRTAQASEAPVEPQPLKTLNQSDDHGHDDDDGHHDVTPTPEPAHDDDDGHHDVTPTPEPAHDDGDGHHAATPTPEPAHDDGDGHHAATPTSARDDGAQDAQPTLPAPTSAPVQPTQQPHDDSDGHHSTPAPAENHDDADGHHGTPVPGDSHGAGGDSHGDDGHGEGTTDSHGEGEGHSEGEGHGRAVPPPDPTTKKIVLGSFAVFNLGVLIVAAVLKRRMPQRTPRPARPS